MRKTRNFIKRLMSRQPARFIMFGFVLIFFIGAILLNMPFASENGQSIGFVKAFFTSTSATCVTGLTVVDTTIHWSVWGKLLILLLIQIGGLGFMTLATFISIALKRGIGIGERFLLAESVNSISMSGIVRLMKHVFFGTFLIESVGALILSLRFIPKYGFGRGIFNGIFLSVSAFCNSGFDTLGTGTPFASLTEYSNDIVVNLIVMALIIIGGIGFLVWEDVYSVKNPKKWRLSTKLALSVTAFLLVGGFLLFSVFEWNNPDTLGKFEPAGKLIPSMFMSVSPRTAGFNTVDLTKMTITSQIITIVLMFIGGSPGSTAGGIKTVAFGIMIYTIISVLRGQDYIHAFKRRITYGSMMRAITLVILALLIIFAGTFAMIAVENYTGYADLDPLDALFEVTCAFTTTGIFIGVTPWLTSTSLILLSGIMFVGRVGIFTFMLSLIIKRANSGTSFLYPEERINI